MKKNLFRSLFVASLLLFSSSLPAKDKNPDLRKMIDTGIGRAIVQYRAMAKVMDTIPGKLPKTILPDGTLQVAKPTWWTSGFMPGVLWYLYEYSGDQSLRQLARNYTQRVECIKDYTGDHDIGFMLYCSFGNGYRIEKDPQYKAVLLKGSESLISRYKDQVGCIRSWDFGPWKYPVIIDNMMNLELLYWAGKNSDKKRFTEIADSHAQKTMKNHFRPDYSSYHVVSYEPKTGDVEKKNTSQGLADSSAWARGQAWGLYGYTVCYRETGNKIYLDHAKKIAGFILNHPRLPKDKIPYWDFDAPNIPNALRDASAASIMASALIELSQYVPRKQGKEYLDVAITQLKNLTSPAYLATPGTNGNFLIKHGVGHMPAKSEIDVPLTYGDYYYVEALMRLKKLKGY